MSLTRRQTLAFGSGLLNRLLLRRTQAASAARLCASNPRLEPIGCASHLQAQRGVDSRSAQARLFNDLHYTHAFAVHAHNLLASFVQYFSWLLAGIFFLHEPLTSQIF